MGNSGKGIARYYPGIFRYADSGTFIYKGHWLAAFVLVLVFADRSTGQSFFSIKINDQNRGYLVVASRSESPNLPLVIVLHADGASAMQAFRSEAVWQKMSRPALLAFPLLKHESWGCRDRTAFYENEIFLSRLIDQIYENYRVDRNRVYIMASGEGYCFIQDFYKGNPSKLAGVFEYSVKQEDDEQSIAAAIDVLIPAGSEKDMGYQLWQKVRLDDRSEEEIKADSIRRNRWHGRTAIALKASRFIMLPGVKTGIDDKTYMDISNVKTLYTLEVTRWINDSMALFIDASWLKIPQKQEVTFDYMGSNASVKGEGGGGAIVPIAIGFKYALHRSAFRPYCQLSTGPIMVFVVGGKFKANSSTLDPSAVRTNLDSESRLVIHFSLGSGYEWRLGKRIYNTGELKYLHSGHFDSAGQVDAIRGFSFGLGFGYILGIKKPIQHYGSERKAP